jgi:hypothetical protein
MTVDLRVPNASTKPTAWPMLQDELHDSNGSELFARLDFRQGYLQIPLHKYLQAAIMESMRLAFPDPYKKICVLTNASDRFYAGLVTQIDEEQLHLTMDEQDH